MSDNSPKVWVTQEGNYDYAPAEEFGSVHFVTGSDLRSMPNSKQNENVKLDIARFKADYCAGIDYIILAGNPMISAMITMALGKGSHKFLKWDGRRAVYILFTLESN